MPLRTRFLRKKDTTLQSWWPTRNFKKISKISAAERGAAPSATALSVMHSSTFQTAPELSRLFVRLGCVTQETIDGRGLGAVQGNVFLSRELQRNEKRFGASQGIFAELFAVLEAELVSELSDKWAVLTACAPDGNISLTGQTVAEVEYAYVL